MRVHKTAGFHAIFAISVLFAAGCAGTQGPPAQPCSVNDNGNGTATIACPDGTTVVVGSGRNGTDGMNGANGTPGTNGTNGTSCTVTANADAGTKTIVCANGTTATISDGKNAVEGVVDFKTLYDTELAALDMTVTVNSITNVAKPVVTFTVTDSKGRAVKNIPFANFSGISLLQLVPGSPVDGGNGLGNDTWVSHITNCATCTASTETATATSLVDNGNGTYGYTFLKDVQNPTPFDGGMAVAGVAFDANAVHRFGLRLAASGNPFRPVDAVYDYVPASGANVTGQHDKVSTAACLECHMQWRGAAGNAGGLTPFHSGQRYEAQYCIVCHNDQRKYVGNAIAGNAVRSEPTNDGLGNLTPAPGSTSISVLKGEAIIHQPVWIHKIHMGEHLTLKGPYSGLGAEINEIRFPQSPANCAKCHKGATLADNWKNKPSRRACGACHDKVDFALGTNHVTGGPQTNDNACGLCHSPTAIASKHVPVVKVDPNNIFMNPTTGSSNTNAAALGIRNNPPAGGQVVTYVMPTNAVTTVDAGAGNVYAQLKFKYLIGDAGVVFNTWDGGNEMMDGFVGGPSIYCAYAMPQDGLAKPADFNVTASAYLRNLWRGSPAGAFAGPDTNGYYTATLNAAAIRPAATMLTCGIGYSYSLSSTQPMTQTNLAAFPYDAGTKVGGLSIPPANVWQVAVGYTGRRGATNHASTSGQIVSAAKCNNCHNQLGVGPSFHGGQRNDSPTCSFCHTQNRTSSGWSAGSENFIHAIHGAGKRTVPFNWHAISEDEGFYKIAYPGRPQMCEGCHNAGYYDFSAPWYSSANVDTRLMQTVAQGQYNKTPFLIDGGVNTAAWSISPYVMSDGGFVGSFDDGGVYTGTDYGKGYAFNAGTGAITEAAASTLVNSPVANACFGCHDSAVAVAHMKLNGGSIYETRGVAKTRVEQCLICHGPGKTAAIKEVHYK